MTAPRNIPLVSITKSKLSRQFQIRFNAKFVKDQGLDQCQWVCVDGWPRSQIGLTFTFGIERISFFIGPDCGYYSLYHEGGKIGRSAALTTSVLARNYPYLKSGYYSPEFCRKNIYQIRLDNGQVL